ncbi:unnamed protein product [Malassezia sympodialis ATCC 42132]|uniref:Uncharacterized protein n=1 Tax=Malassezia sympodialis (strain ATCC 42132) TaxID=1230383 RepID=M5EDM9_MALS4|nr:uncharacterized protein MSY001_3462 [Malassezia sympodialis ATCC 42132]CCV00756.1 unnamed protein product [Malassezia sympodialis ATCC 42132]SHO79936.1 Uncharacterized protein MSYG_4291 [Malassezia sympodialis ATCC 42132]|eukprot:XP_018741931.1 uncharacterized protein MSY001_3462 [Malassezia sympodialis ATCC 42132]
MDAFDSGTDLSGAGAGEPARTESRAPASVSAAAPPPADDTTQAPRAKRPRTSLPPSEAEKAADAEGTRPRADDSVETVRSRARVPVPNPSKEASFGRNMSGWDQLFGGIPTAAPTESVRPKDITPEQKAAAAEAEALKVREARAKEAQERAKEKEERAKEAIDRAKEKERETAAMAREAREAREARTRAAAASAPPPERRALSVTAEALNEKRRQLQREIENPQAMDLLANGRIMFSFEEELGSDRRSLRASKFGAGLHHLRAT